MPAQLPNDGFPPLGSLSLGLLLLFRSLGLTDLNLVLLCVPLQIVQATLGFVLQNKLKQTVVYHFAYKVKHGSMN